MRSSRLTFPSLTLIRPLPVKVREEEAIEAIAIEIVAKAMVETAAAISPTEEIAAVGLVLVAEVEVAWVEAVAGLDQESSVEVVIATMDANPFKQFIIMYVEHKTTG